MRAGGCDAISVACDVTDAAGISRLAAAAAERGPLGSVVYVAGLSPSSATFKDIIKVNLTGAALAMHALLPSARSGSSAVLISSVAAHFYHPEPHVAALLAEAGSPDLADRLAEALGDEAIPGTAYTMSKWGMNLLAWRQAKAWGNVGARIVSLSPAFVATPMGAIEFEKSPGKRQIYEQIPLRRESTMLEVADARASQPLRAASSSSSRRSGRAGSGGPPSRSDRRGPNRSPPSIAASAPCRPGTAR
jgi:NAD(P)-dependent dehydrogenase (short-subunit alcohol dehydrogenase family)